MRLIEYYIRLFITYGQAKTDQQISVSRCSISKELECSDRNVSHILNKMETEHWIKIIRGKGRGNLTNITFFKKLTEMFELFEKTSPKTEDIERLISILENNPLLESQLLINTLINKLFRTKVGLVQEGEDDEDKYLKIPYYRSLYSLDPAQVERQTERHIVQQIFNTLVIYNEDKKELHSCLSHFWELSHDGMAITFYLRKRIQFHNSRNLTSEDVKFTFERLQQTPSKWIVKDLETIKCIGKYIIQFTFTRAAFHWVHLITSPKCSIIPYKYANKTLEEFSKLPIGTGPYRIKEHETNFIQLKVHDDYFQERAHIENISIFILPSIEKYLNATDINQDPIYYVPFTIKKDKDVQLQYIERERLSIKYLMWNMNKEKIRTNKEVRIELSSILNKKSMIIDLGYPRYECASSFIKQYTDSKCNMSKLSRDSFKEPLTLLTYDLTPNIEDVEWIKQECKKYGVEIEVKNVPYSTFLDNAKSADLVLAEYVTEESQEVSLYNLVESQTGVIYNLIDSENKSIIQEILRKTFQQENMKDRIEILKKADMLLCNEYITIPLYWTFQKALYDKNLMGMELSTIGLVPFKNLFYRKQL